MIAEHDLNKFVRAGNLLEHPPGFGAERRGDTLQAAAPASAPSAPGAPAAPVTAAAAPAVQTVARRVDPPADQVTARSGALRKTTHIKVGA